MKHLLMPVDPSVFSSVILIFCCLCLKIASPTNLCSTAGLCCKHRDSECVAQKVFPNHTVDTSQLPCYCDHACVKLDDCCPDYKHFCAVHDCKVSEWGPWSQCSVRCGSGGFTERHRVILHQASNGGVSCPHLVQAKPCSGRACDEEEPEEKWTEGLSSTFSGSEEPATTSSVSSSGNNDNNFEDKQNIFHTLVTSPPEKHQTSCIEMVIIRATKGCQHHDSRLHIGTRICVNCPHNSLKPPQISRSSKMSGGQNNDIATTDFEAEPLEVEENCAELTQTPIRQFRISDHCHGKLTFLAPDPTTNCSCGQGLHFRLIPENV